jgi:DNA adenine methylase
MFDKHDDFKQRVQKGDALKPLGVQPIPYQGSKRQLAPRICALFPKNVKTLYEPFSGSAAITLYAASHNLAEHFVIGDILPELVNLWRLIIEEPQAAALRYKTLWEKQFEDGYKHFNIVRDRYNAERDPVCLLYLIARCVKNAVRFNKDFNFTQSADNRRTGMRPDKMEKAMRFASCLLKGKTTLFCGDFKDCIASARPGDLIYMDPPYQGTTYGRDKRYAAQLKRDYLVDVLRDINARDIPFILSYDGQTGDKVYADPLPNDLADCLAIYAGRSSQATLAGRVENTVESLYVSKSLLRRFDKPPDYSQGDFVCHTALGLAYFFD